METPRRHIPCIPDQEGLEFWALDQDTTDNWDSICWEMGSHSASSSRLVYFKVGLLQLHGISQLAIVTQKEDPSWQESSSRGWTRPNEDVDTISKGSVFANLGTMLQRKGSALMQILRVQARTWRQQSLPDTRQTMQQHHCNYTADTYQLCFKSCIALPPMLLSATDTLNFHCSMRYVCSSCPLGDLCNISAIFDSTHLGRLPISDCLLWSCEARCQYARAKLVSTTWFYY